MPVTGSKRQPVRDLMKVLSRVPTRASVTFVEPEMAPMQPANMRMNPKVSIASRIQYVAPLEERSEGTREIKLAPDLDLRQ